MGESWAHIFVAFIAIMKSTRFEGLPNMSINPCQRVRGEIRIDFENTISRHLLINLYKLPMLFPFAPKTYLVIIHCYNPSLNYSQTVPEGPCYPVHIT